jgi:hypothetical protein
MTQQLETLITLLLYTLFFAWIGYQRGSLREIIVTVAAVGGWLALQEAGSLLIRIVNLGSKFVAFVRAGGLGENPDQAFGALGSAAPWVTTEQRGEFLLIVWVFLLIFAYVISNLKPFAKASKSDAWSILLGIVNGLFFATILLPRLATLVQPNNLAPGESVGISNLFGILRGAFTLVQGNFGGLWGLLANDQRSLVLLILLTIFLLLAASTIKGASKKSSSDKKKRINLGKPSSAEKRS